MKLKNIAPLFVVACLSSCSSTSNVVESKVFCFDTVVDIKLYNADSSQLKEVENIVNRIDKLTDNFKERDVTNVYSINQSNSDYQIDSELYDLLYRSVSVSGGGANYFNPLAGSLINRWKEALKSSQIIDEATILSEVNKIQNSSISFKDNYIVSRYGEALVDLGGIAKGYALDRIKTYLESVGLKQYLINAGSSSILLGEKDSDDHLFSVGIKDLDNTYLKLNNCFVSTSGISSQGVEINGVIYSHIINPYTGSAINNYDAVVVISNNGAFGDALSTSMMNNTLEEIRQIENDHKVQTIVIKDKKIVYKHYALEVFKH